MDRDQEFTAYYADRGARMRSYAYLLCGNWHLAEDLAQTAFVKLYLAWNRVNERSTLDQYLRRIITRSVLDEWRRPWRRERPTGSLALLDRATADPPADERIWLRRVLSDLPPRQRATLVLRFWEDLSVTQTAEVLGVSEGTVKSQTAHGLRALRDLLDGYGEPGAAGPPPTEEAPDERA